RHIAVKVALGLRNGELVIEEQFFYFLNGLYIQLGIDLLSKLISAGVDVFKLRLPKAQNVGLHPSDGSDLVKLVTALVRSAQLYVHSSLSSSLFQKELSARGLPSFGGSEVFSTPSSLMRWPYLAVMSSFRIWQGLKVRTLL